MEDLELNGNKLKEVNGKRLSTYEASRLLDISRKRVWERIKVFVETEGKRGMGGIYDEHMNQYYTTFDDVVKYDEHRRALYPGMFN